MLHLENNAILLRVPNIKLGCSSALENLERFQYFLTKCKAAKTSFLIPSPNRFFIGQKTVQKPGVKKPISTQDQRKTKDFFKKFCIEAEGDVSWVSYPRNLLEISLSYLYTIYHRRQK